MSPQFKQCTTGDTRRVQSIAVWAISEGREAARIIDKFLMGLIKAGR